MKKKAILFSMAGIMALSVSAAVLSTWVKVSDPNCNKCVMNDTERKCGLCAKKGTSGFMAQVDGTGKFVGAYLQYNYKCNTCGHTITYKNK